MRFRRNRYCQMENLQHLQQINSAQIYRAPAGWGPEPWSESELSQSLLGLREEAGEGEEMDAGITNSYLS